MSIPHTRLQDNEGFINSVHCVSPVPRTKYILAKLNIYLLNKWKMSKSIRPVQAAWLIDVPEKDKFRCYALWSITSRVSAY